MQKRRDKLLKGPVVKTILFLSIPIIIANLLQTVYNLTDTFWVGRLGAESVAAVSISFPIIFLLMSLVMGFSSAGMAFISQAFGKGDQKNTNFYSGQSFIWIILIAILFSIIGAFYSEGLIRLFNPTPLVYSQAVDYLRISFYGVVFMFAYMIFMSILRGVGEVKIPLYLVLGTTILNFLIDPMFIYGFWFIPASGVSGVAWATFITQGIAAFLGLGILLSGKYGVKISLKDFIPRTRIFKKLLSVGFPSAIERSLSSIGLIIFTWVISISGTIALAAYGIGSKIVMMVLIPSMGLAMAVMTFVGQNMGAGKLDRAKKGSQFGLVGGFVGLLLVGIITFLIAKPLVTFFIPGDLEVIREATSFVRIVSFCFGFIALQVVAGGVYKAAGRTWISLSFGIIQIAILVLSSLFLQFNGFPESSLWFAYSISYFIAGIFALIIYLTGNWEKNKIKH